MKLPIRWQLIGGACGAAGLALQAQAGGFALVEHGVSGLGNAYAGAAAVAHDTSTVFFNPAGMTELPGREMGIGVHILRTDTDWSDRGTSLAPLVGGGEVSGPDSAEAGVTTPLPNFYYSAPLGERWRYGLSIDAPFGSSTEYDSDWKGRYTTINSSISVIDVNPAVAYRVSDKLRLGFGLSVQFLSAELGSAVDSGAACFATVGTEDPAFCANNGLLPGNFENDGFGEVTGDSTAVSFNVGALFLPREDTRLGIAYRHGASHEADASADFRRIPDALRGALDAGGVTAGFLVDQDAEAKLELPPTLLLSVAHELTERVELLADLTWTGWSSFEELRVTYENGPLPQADTLSVQEWEDVVRLSAGVNFRLDDRWTLRGGVAFDEEAIPSPERRTARIPGNDRTWLAFGAGYDVNEDITLDIGYAHLFLPDTAIDNPNAETRGGSAVRGEYDSSVDILGFQFNWHFN